jgi:hypothetical protein
MNTKVMLAIIGVALVAAALVGVSAQFVGAQNATNSTSTQGVPPCVNNGVIPPYCINATTGEPYCIVNGAYAGYCYNGDGAVNGYGYCQNGGCNGYGVQAQNQYEYGLMGRSGYGMGCRR